ncbi:MAG: hypothetical protein D9V47_14625 [Clostridia bacterium]|nr:MAG: hypothetical protein D9V47_14625 [Clostridia bacterium]
MSARSKRWLFITAVIIFTLSTAARAADLLPPLEVSDLERVDFTRSNAIYRPLFPDVQEDGEKIGRLVTLYNQALASLGPEISFYEEFGDIMPMFLNSRSLPTRPGSGSPGAAASPGAGAGHQHPQGPGGDRRPGREKVEPG